MARGYEHLATKADIAELRSEVRAMKWMLGLGLTAVVAVSAVLQVIALLPTS